MRLQYLAGMGLNVDAQDQIYSELMEARRIPPGLFIASTETLAKLRIHPVTERWPWQYR
jgi:hypothetical protein